MKTPIITALAAAGMMAAFADTSTNTSSTGVVTPEKLNPWDSSVSAGLSLTRGNSDSTLFTIKLLTERKGLTDEFLFGADVSYGSSNSQENNQTTHGFGQWNHLFSERTYGDIRVEGLHDGIANIKYRVTLTAGLGYYFIKEKNTTLAGEVGLGEVFERLGNKNDNFTAVRFAERFEHKFSEHSARIWQSVELLPQVDKWSNYLMNFEVGVEAAVAKNVSLQACLDDNYASQPAAGRKRNDVKLVSGIAYKF